MLIGRLVGHLQWRKLNSVISGQDPLRRDELSSLSDQLQLEQIINGRYQILAYVGSGNFGMVYKAGHIQTGQLVALKTLCTGASENARQRLEREFKLLTTLRHQSIVAVFDFGFIDNKRPYLITEWIPACTLADILEQRRALPYPLAVIIFKELCAALSFAHKKGVLHRDIKPSNIFVSLDKKPEVRLIDFGVGKFVDEEDVSDKLTKSGELVGTPYYMSPEQCAGLKQDERSDIYSLGCVMYETITGKPPFAGTNLLQVLSKHLQDNPESINSSEHHVPEALSKIVMRSLEKDPTKRFANVDALQRALAQIDQRTPIGSRITAILTSVIAVSALVAIATFWLSAHVPKQLPATPPKVDLSPLPKVEQSPLATILIPDSIAKMGFERAMHKGAELYKSGRYEEALPYFAFCYQLTDAQPEQEYLHSTLIQLKKFDVAERLAKEGLDSAGRNNDELLAYSVRLGEAYESQHHYDDLIRDLEPVAQHLSNKRMSHSNNTARLYWLLANAYFNRGKFEESIKFLNKELAVLHEEYPDVNQEMIARYELAMCLNRLHKYEEAAAQFKIVRQLPVNQSMRNADWFESIAREERENEKKLVRF
jgi:serine/threonine protein kinase